MILSDGWIIPERGAPWLIWGFGTRHTVLRNELASVKQVHGARVVTVTETGIAGEADALVTNSPGLVLGIKTADCLPILMADMNQRVVAAVHAGWRGTVQDIAGSAVRAMEEKFKSKPNDLLAAMGPAIGRCCFEVGAEVARQFTKYDPDLGNAIGKRHLDLQAINTRNLVDAGVLPGNILRSQRCTVCEVEDLWSFRREGERAGRMWSVVGSRSSEPHL